MQRLQSRFREVAFLALLLSSFGSLHAQRRAVTADTVWMENFWIETDIVIDGNQTSDIHPIFHYTLEQEIGDEGRDPPLSVREFEVAHFLPYHPVGDVPTDTGSYWRDPQEGWRRVVGGPPRVRLPDDARWTVGLEWRDTTDLGYGVPGGDWTRSRMSYRVAEIKDTLGAHAAIVEVRSHTQQFRSFDPASIVTPSLLSTQAIGTGQARYVVDTRTGRILARTGEARATGVAAMIRGDTVRPAVSQQGVAWLRRPVASERRALLWRARSFGSSETTTFRWSPEVYHRTDLRGDTAESLHVSTTSGVTVGRTEFREGRVARHFVERTGPEGSRAESIVVQGEEGAGDLRLRPPTGVVGWGVAEVGMEEHLWPVLAGLAPAKQPQRFAIYRPLERSWDRVMIRSLVSNQDKMFVVTRPDGQPLQVLCYAMESGALLFSVRPVGEHWESRMVPREEGRIRAILAWSRFVAGVFPQVRSFPGPV